MSNQEAPLWFSTEAVAHRYDVPISTVRKWRVEGTGPVGARFGRHVRYSLGELERWEREQVARQAS